MCGIGDLWQVRKVSEEKLQEVGESYGKIIGRTQHEKGFIAGDKLSAAELALYACIKHMRHPFIGLSKTFGDDIPQIKKVMDLVDHIPEVQAYYKI